MSKNIPPIKDNPYRKEKWGYYGELGDGANAKIRFLQTVISHDELDDIELISNIPGSEKWDVRDLFQRDVDEERVTKDILPYMQDKNKIKFFNPLTLIILPMDENGRDVLKDIDYIYPSHEEYEGHEYECYEKKGYYKFRIHKADKAYGQIHWNDRKCYIVALDGQHRLSALKRWKAMPRPDELYTWKIPVVILNIFKVELEESTANLLEMVRKTFMYINTKAEKVNKLRQILLNDESVNAICTQELIQYSHSNDNKPIEERDDSVVPLLFYDWRGETKHGYNISGIASVKNIEEIYNWFYYYILGEDEKDTQKIELEIEDLSPPLDNYGADKPLTYEDSTRIRHQFRTTVLPGLTSFLKNFTPYKEYIGKCRIIEKESIERSDISQHAFMKLRFGSHDATDHLRDQVDDEYDNLTQTFSDLKAKLIDDIIQRDIGMRGIMFAFGNGKREYEEIINVSITWSEYTDIVQNSFNKIYSEGWFKSFTLLEAAKRKILTNIIFDEAGSIINYRLQDTSNALGAFLIVLLFKDLLDTKIIDEDGFNNIWNNYSDSLRSTILKSVKKTVRASLRNEFAGTQKAFNNEVNKLSEIEVNKSIKNIIKYFGIE